MTEEMMDVMIKEQRKEEGSRMVLEKLLPHA